MASIHALAAHLIPGNVVPGKDDLEKDHPGKTPSGQARLIKRGAPVSRAAAQETYYIEDGWVFREHHGKYVECICRTEEIPTAQTHNMPVFQNR